MAENPNPVPVQPAQPVQPSGFSYWTGIGKTIKNVAVVLGVPALIFLVDNYTQWVPTQYVTNPFIVTIFGAAAYFVKNLVENHPAFGN